MNRPRSGVARLVLTCLLGGMIPAGCDRAPSPNLSPTAEQDPARFERAEREAEERARKNREAERKAMRRLPGAGLAGH